MTTVFGVLAFGNLALGHRFYARSATRTRGHRMLGLGAWVSLAVIFLSVLVGFGLDGWTLALWMYLFVHALIFTIRAHRWRGLIGAPRPRKTKGIVSEPQRGSTMPTKADANRWLDNHVGAVIDTVQTLPDGQTWQPGKRTLARHGTLFHLVEGDRSSTVRITAQHRVVEVNDKFLTIEWVDPDSKRVIHATTYKMVKAAKR